MQVIEDSNQVSLEVYSDVPDPRALTSTAMCTGARRFSRVANPLVVHARKSRSWTSPDTHCGSNLMSFGKTMIGEGTKRHA